MPKILDSYLIKEHTDPALANSAGVTVVDDEGVFYASHASFQRGGCLNAGWVVLRNLKTGTVKEVDVTSNATTSDAHINYLLSLAEKHLGGNN